MSMNGRVYPSPIPDELHVDVLVKRNSSPELMAWLCALPHDGLSKHVCAALEEAIKNGLVWKVSSEQVATTPLPFSKSPAEPEASPAATGMTPFASLSLLDLLREPPSRYTDR